MSASIPSAIRAHFTESVSFTVETAVGEDAYGNSVTTTTAQLARVDYGETKFTNASGQEMFSTAQIYTDDIPTFTAEGTVTLPGGKVEKVLSIKRNRWPNGAYSMEVYV